MLVVDCQTTGASPALGAVLEVGWCVVRPNSSDVHDLQAHWIALPAGHTVPSLIRRLTGFEQGDAAHALEPQEAWQRLRASMSATTPMPTAIHFARFELSFLRDWASRFEPEAPFPIDAVCLHALARHLYPDLPRRTLRALAGFLGHGLHLERRSLGHVEATAFVWRKLSLELASRGVQTWDELRALCATPVPASSRAVKRRFPMPSSRYRELPNDPGVYRFVRSNDDVLYVGKAASLRKRVASHFTKGSATEHALEMLTQVSDVRVTVTATALEAALLENESIKSLSPPYNAQLVLESRKAWFATSAFADAVTKADEDHRIGPLPSRLALAPLEAFVAMNAGGVGSASVRARALATAEAWAPDEAMFSAGLEALLARHAPEPAKASPRRSALDLAKRVLLWVRSQKASDEQESEDEAAAGDTAAWDVPRVARHLERNLAQAYQLYRRARWLCLVHDCRIVYREPASERTRLLVVVNGDIAEARDLLQGEAVPAAPGQLRIADRHRAFDGVKYDRLRVLTTELKRIQRDQGSVSVHLGRRRALCGRALDGVLQWV